ncbi:alanine--tRNA ligase [Pelagibacteraceae bacterium]|nr:alanine--tRNA ligase [Pelagibacteraceae bacterium]
MNSSEIRSIFLNYFNKNGHEIVHSSPLVPHNDPTLMFANSGMVQFKNIFTGKEKRDYKRAVTSQKCVRAGGKHNDLENVGYTARHHTFFEMLGNFSFGDYFKNEAIEFAWNLITKEFGIDKKKLLVTVFNEDEDAYNLWKTVAGLDDDKIIKINTSDNFWSMGDTGPCGPCSEIFYDHGDKYPGGPPGSPNEDGDRFIEIWNLVFMQFEQISSSERVDLPKPSIDTGMGLERITALLNGTNDNYNTDLFNPLIDKSIQLLNNESLNESPSHRVIADHLRSSSFLIADGVSPSNEGRGYVLRRIMRRGMRHAHSLGNKDPIFAKMFPTLLETFQNSFPELERANDLILNTFLNEETKFKETVEKGLKILEEEISSSPKKLDGEIAFKLYDTYGFPLDLTQDYLRSKNIEVDIDTFNIKMKEQKDRARQSWKGTGDIEDQKKWFQITENLNPTEFLGYEQNETESEIISIIKNDTETELLSAGDEAIIILNQTPFYGESGGQIGDSGKIIFEDNIFEVYDTTKLFGSFFLHHGIVKNGQFSKKESVTAIIDTNKRQLTKCNHSSTHLLHSSLREVLGNHVSQKGSLVNNEKLRFDFSHNEPISSDNIIKIENYVKMEITKNSPVNTKIIDHQKAIEEGAMALFGEKYGDEVRVVSMGSKEGEKIFSKELCGGTHVNHTGDIIDFKIINQSSVASGIRRLEALTNISVKQFENEQIRLNKQKEDDNKIKIDQLIKEIQKIDGNFTYSNKNNDSLPNQIKELRKSLDNKKQNLNKENTSQNILSEKINDTTFVYLVTDDYPPKLLKQFVDDQKNKYQQKCVSLIISSNANKLSIVLGATNDLIDSFDSSKIIQEVSKILGGKGGGGRKDIAQAGGADLTNLEDAINKIRDNLNF